MSRQTKERHSCRREVEEETYKEFIRQKVLKYQHQFPRMTQYEIYQKIGREWQAFNLKQKQELYNMYVNNNFITTQATIKEQHQPQREIQEYKEVQKNQQFVLVQKDQKPQEKLKEENIERRTTRGMSKICNKNKETKQQMIAQTSSGIKNQPMAYLQLGQTVSKKLTNLDPNNKQSMNLYKVVLEEVKKQHRKVVASCLSKGLFPLELPVQVEKAALKLKEINKTLQKIEEQPAEQESSQLSPQPQKQKKQTKESKSKLDIETQNQRLRLAIKLKIDQSLRKDYSSLKINNKKNQYLAVKLQEKPVLPKKTSDYLQFYKKGYKQLKQSCNFLTGLQITQILTNLWQKQKVLKKLALKNNKSYPAQSINQPEKKIELSSILARKIGKMNFIKSKLKQDYLLKEAQKLWTSLPLQSKIKWIHPDKRHYQQLIDNQQGPLHGIVRYKSNETCNSKFYDLNWDIFDQTLNEQNYKCPQEQCMVQKQ